MSEGSWVGLDVHARSVVAGVIDVGSGEVRSLRLPPGCDATVAWLQTLPAPVRVVYEAGPTGYRLALGGHVVSSIARSTASTVLVIAVAFTLGFRPHTDVPRWLAAVGMLLAFVTAISWLAAAIGLLARSTEAANGTTFFVMFIPYASSAFVPVHTMPHWLQGFAQHQPITPLTEALRSLLLGTPVGSNAWIALAWCTGIAAISIAAAGSLFARRTA